MPYVSALNKYHSLERLLSTDVSHNVYICTVCPYRLDGVLNDVALYVLDNMKQQWYCEQAAVAEECAVHVMACRNLNLELIRYEHHNVFNQEPAHENNLIQSWNKQTVLRKRWV